MRKFLLVLFIGTVLVLNLYGFSHTFLSEENEINDMNDVGTVVYVEE